jgi:nucleoside-diphosphate-sugar epimerase
VDVKGKVVVAGASGLVGLAAVKHFARLGWEVVGVSRREPAPVEGAVFVQADLLDPAACEAIFSGFGDVTHVVYAALHETPGLMPGWLDDGVIATNGAMLRNLFEPLSRIARGLQHVSLLHGTKAYGIHHPSLGVRGLRIPLRERDPRREHPNFYWVQEEYLRTKQAGQDWGLTTFRPTVIYGDATGANMNPALAIGAYAALLKEAGEPLHFPGKSLAPWVHEAVDADLVAEALAWAAVTPRAWGEAYNLTNGDVFTWSQAWEAIAEGMGMVVGEHRPISFVADLPSKSAEWAAIVAKHALTGPDDLVAFAGYNSLVYCDVMVGPERRGDFPVLNSTIKARQHGFAACRDTEDMFRTIFARLRANGVLPLAGRSCARDGARSDWSEGPPVVVRSGAVRPAAAGSIRTMVWTVEAQPCGYATTAGRWRSRSRR